MKNIEELIKKAIEKKPSTTDDLLNLVEDEIRKIPHLKDITNKIILCRGTITHLSIDLENILNEILLFSNNRPLVYSKFNKKIAFIKYLTKKADKDKQIKKEFYKKLDRVVKIRNLYAHVPINVFSKELKFNYERFHEKWKEEKTIIELNREFKKIMDELLEEMEEIIIMIKESLKK